MLITFKVVSQEVLQSMHVPIYRDAASAIYEAFYGDLRARLVSAMIVGGLIIVVALACGPYGWAVWLRRALGLRRLRHTKPYGWAAVTRHWTARYGKWLDLAAAGLTLLSLLLFSTVTISTVVIALSCLLAFVALVQLVSHPAPAAQQ